MKKCSTHWILLLLLLFSSFLFSQDWVEVVYLKNGSIIKGVIIEQIPNVSLKFQTADGSIFVYKMEEVLKIAKEEVKPKVEPGPEIEKETMTNIPEYKLKPGERIPSQKDPAVALIFSVLIVGAGQYYNGDIGTGIVQEIFYIGSIIDLLSVDYHASDADTYIYLGVAGLIGTTLWSWINAPLRAESINKRREYLLKREKMQSLKLIPIILPEKEETKVGVSLRF